jgi:hypothetical protein
MEVFSFSKVGVRWSTLPLSVADDKTGKVSCFKNQVKQYHFCSCMFLFDLSLRRDFVSPGETS